MILQIVSGGQTGVDRAALDAALERSFPCGGWCPAGRRAEDGVLDPRYPLRETVRVDYPPRTLANVRDSDGTLIVRRGGGDRGTELTRRAAAEQARPLLIVDLAETTPGDAIAAILSWSRQHGVEVLNVAGPRESRRPGVYGECLELMRVLLAALDQT